MPSIVDEIKSLIDSGVSKTQGAKLLGFRLRKLNDILEAACINWPTPKKTFVVDGVVGTAKDHAARLGISDRSARYQKYNKSGVRLTRITAEDVRKFDKMVSGGMTAKDAAASLGRRASSVRDAKKSLKAKGLL